MSNILSRVSRSMLVVAVTAGLGFGANEAFAGSAGGDCFDPNKGYFGYCSSQEHCEAICASYGLPGGVCDTFQDCCVCPI